MLTAMLVGVNPSSSVVAAGQLARRCLIDQDVLCPTCYGAPPLEEGVRRRRAGRRHHELRGDLRTENEVRVIISYQVCDPRCNVISQGAFRPIADQHQVCRLGCLGARGQASRQA